MYGVPSYMEANPAPFAIITFPFFFGMMFGDYGHGSLMFLIGLLLTMGADKLKNTSLAPILQGRYFLLCLGACSMFNGLLYNEFFAIPNDWFGTCFNLTVRNGTDTVDNTNSGNYVYPPLTPGKKFVWNSGYKLSDEPLNTAEYEFSSNYTGNDCVYTFGTDPAWYLNP